MSTCLKSGSEIRSCCPSRLPVRPLPGPFATSWPSHNGQRTTATIASLDPQCAVANRPTRKSAMPDEPDRLLVTTIGEFPLHEYRLHVERREWTILHINALLTHADERRF